MVYFLAAFSAILQIPRCLRPAGTGPMFLLIIHEVFYSLFLDHFQIGNTASMMRHAIVIEIFQNGAWKIDAFTAVGQILILCAIPDFTASTL